MERSAYRARYGATVNELRFYHRTLFPKNHSPIRMHETDNKCYSFWGGGLRAYQSEENVKKDKSQINKDRIYKYSENRELKNAIGLARRLDM